MNTLRRLASNLGCLLSVVLPLVGLVLYPRARWLFGFAIIGIAVLVLNVLFRKEPSPLDVADHAEGLLEGRTATWDVDDYEHLRPREPRLRDLWSRTMAVGGLPEEWVRLDESKANELRDIIRQMRDLGGNRK
jgi:hypothetical protein